MRNDEDDAIGRLDHSEPGAVINEAGMVKDGHRHGWYLPNINIYPKQQAFFDRPLGPVIRDAVLPGHAPAAPLLNEHHSVVTIGSCFARELRLFLKLSGVEANRFWVPSGLNNTFAILDFVSWCVTGSQTGRGFRYERDDVGAIHEWMPDAERDAYLKVFANTGAFVFTLGLAEVWQDRETGGVFWRGIPASLFNADRHVFRLTTVDENRANIKQTIALIRSVNATAPIVVTLSPVPLLATHRSTSCLTADCVSKSVLRIAIDDVMADSLPGVYYWPSFEIVKWVGANSSWNAYGEGGKSRNVSRRVVVEIIDAFLESFYEPAAIAAMRSTRGKIAYRDRLVEGDAD